MVDWDLVLTMCKWLWIVRPANRLLAFYDLGSARMNLEMVEEFSDKEILIQQVPLIEGPMRHQTLLQAGAE